MPSQDRGRDRPDGVPTEVGEPATDGERIRAHPSVRRVRDALAGDRVIVLDGSARTAADAAAQLGTDVAHIANSLVFMAIPAGGPPAPDPYPVLVLASGAQRVDVRVAAATLGVAELRRASAEQVRDATGMAIGGVAPFGHPDRLRTLVDASLDPLGQVWAAAGHPRTVFPITHDELVELTGGRSGPVR